MEANGGPVSLQEAIALLISLLKGERTWAHVGLPYDEVADGEATFVTADGWVVSLHRSYGELKHTDHILSPDGRRGSEANWAPEAKAAGRLWGDPLDVLREPEFDWLEELAYRALPCGETPSAD